MAVAGYFGWKKWKQHKEAEEVAGVPEAEKNLLEREADEHEDEGAEDGETVEQPVVQAEGAQAAEGDAQQAEAPV